MKTQKVIIIQNTLFVKSSTLSKKDVSHINSSLILNLVAPYVTEIQTDCFYDWNVLRFAYLPLLKIVHYNAFAMCSSLFEVISPNLRVVKECGFNSCFNLSLIDLRNVEEFGFRSFDCCSLHFIENHKVVKLIGSF